MGRNGFMLRGRLARRGYDWWWHNLIAVHSITGERKPFFIEYYCINPAVSPARVVLGQAVPGGQIPSYAMVKAGTWGKDARQLHQFFPAGECEWHGGRLQVRIGNNTATETSLKGSVAVSARDAAQHPEWMCGDGSMSWDLTCRKILTYAVGYGASALFRWLGLFDMFWHAEGMQTQYSGTITWQGEVYQVDSEAGNGYQDKNWGRDYTNPWIWLSCNTLRRTGGDLLPLTSLDVGGGTPRIWGIPLGRRILVALYIEGCLYEFNFSKFWRRNHQTYSCRTEAGVLYWDIEAESGGYRVEIRFLCPLSEMLKVNYENPRGEKHHQNLWNGGHATGVLKLYRKKGRGWDLLEELQGEYAGCEYGEY